MSPKPPTCDHRSAASDGPSLTLSGHRGATGVGSYRFLIAACQNLADVNLGGDVGIVSEIGHHLSPVQLEPAGQGQGAATNLLHLDRYRPAGVASHSRPNDGSALNGSLCHLAA